MAARAVTSQLTEDMETRGAKFARGLNEAGFTINLAAWVWLEEPGEWRYFIETPLAKSNDLISSYYRVDRFASLVIDAGLDADEVHILDPGAQFTELVLSFIDNFGGGFGNPVRLSGNTLALNRQEIPIRTCVVFHAERAMDSANISRRRDAFDKRMKELEAAS